MRRLLNQPEKYVEEMLEGLYAAHADQITYAASDLHCLINKTKKPGKVAIVTGGGSGHLPLFLGYVGENMLDGCAIGDVFQSPSPEQILKVTKAVEAGAGVLYIYGNYNGDIFNFDMAADMADMEADIRTETVIGKDDIVAEQKDKRRGVAGVFFVYKCAGAAAAAMLDLDEVKRIAQKAADSVFTLGMALSPCIVPRVGKAGFEIGENEMEIGMGIHGEPGLKREELRTADETCEEMMQALLQDAACRQGDEVDVLINGLGATPLEDQYIVYRKTARILKEKGIAVHRCYIGEYATSMEMVGLSISLCKLDDELKKWMEMPATTPMFVQV